MKQLTLVRHAKAVQDPSFAADSERPLADRGRAEASLVGRFLAHADLAPDLIVTSPAVRARQTAELLAQGAEYRGPIVSQEAIYLAGTADLLEVARALPDDAAHVLLIGHNPGFEEFAAALLGATSGVRMPTTAAAHFAFPVERWQEVAPGRGELQWLMTPKLLRK